MNESHKKLLLACDLDRTVLPNGNEELSKGAMELFVDFASKEWVTLAYLSGRNLALIKEAIHTYDIPVPDIAVGDVGTSMYFKESDFTLHDGWSKEIASDWNGKTGDDIAKLVEKVAPNLKRQEDEHQNIYKLSYYTAVDADGAMLRSDIGKLLTDEGINAAVVFSVDELHGKGFLDILPKEATKKHALQYLEKQLGLTHEQIVFAGDSGNDLEPLTSGYPAILVKNASSSVKEEVMKTAASEGVLNSVYFAKGDFRGMNGNYVAGILEGLDHYGYDVSG